MHSEIIVIDGFCANPDQQRDYALGLSYDYTCNYPGKRTTSDENELRDLKGHM